MDHLDVLPLVGFRGTGDQAGGEKDGKSLVAEARCGDEGPERSHRPGVISGLFRQFPDGGLLGRLAGFPGAGGELEENFIHRIPVLAHQHDAVPLGDRDDGHGARVPDHLATDFRALASLEQRFPDAGHFHAEQPPAEHGQTGTLARLRHVLPSLAVLRQNLRSGMLSPVVLLALLAAGQDEPDVRARSELEARGDRQLYNYAYDDAEATYRKLDERYEHDPAGPYARASVIWSRIAQRSGSLRGATHRGDRFWTQPRKPAVTPEEESDFRRFTEEAMARADRMLRKDPDDPVALYYRGATEGLVSGWEMVVERSFLRAFRSGLRAVGAHRRVLELDPEFWDAYAIVGAYEYGLATLPRVLRMLAFLTGRRGNRERGLAYLRTTSNRGTRARWGAMWSEAVILQREGMDAEALERVRLMRREFPENPDLPLEEAGLLNMLGSHRAARDIVERFIRDHRAGFGNYELAAPGLARLRLGESLLFEERWAEAETAFTEGLAEHPQPELEAMLLLRRGNARDGDGRPGEAGSDYLRVRKSEADEVLADWADGLRRRPWPGGAPEELLPLPASRGSRPESRDRK